VPARTGEAIDDLGADLLGMAREAATSRSVEAPSPVRRHRGPATLPHHIVGAALLPGDEECRGAACESWSNRAVVIDNGNSIFQMMAYPGPWHFINLLETTQ
jgi:hypothetical protein